MASEKSGIEWTESTWSPTKGCDRVSPGCDHCYAMTMAKRLKGMGSPGYQLDGDPRTSGPGFLAHESPNDLDWPLRKTKPRLIFVNSMSDLFHDNISDEFIAQVFAVMAASPRHTFQVLTKRHGRMRSLLSSQRFAEMYDEAVGILWHERGWITAQQCNDAPELPLPNVWLGVSVENQQWADIRISALLATPAAVRFLSCEPLLGPVDLARALPSALMAPLQESIGWVITGGESGPDARPMHPDWARSLRDQCVAAGVPFLFKQWGEWSPTARNVQMSKHRWQYESIRSRPTGERYTANDVGSPETGYSAPGMQSLIKVGKKAAGRVLDGRTWDQYPERAA